MAVVPVRHTARPGEYFFAATLNLTCTFEKFCHFVPRPSAGNKKNEQRGPLWRASYSSAFRHRLRPQKSIHRDQAARNLTQSLSETKGRLFPPCEDVAQVRVRALSGVRKLLDGHSIRFGPTKHRVLF